MLVLADRLPVFPEKEECMSPEPDGKDDPPHSAVRLAVDALRSQFHRLVQDIRGVEVFIIAVESRCRSVQVRLFFSRLFLKAR